jgi:hypothetical protein
MADLNTALDYAITQFEYRQKATGRQLPHDPDWPRVMGESVKAALAGDRGITDQQQCAYQAIRLTMWEGGWVRAPWTKAFLPAKFIAPVVVAAPPIAWYRQSWNKITSWYRSLLKRFNDFV